MALEWAVHSFDVIQMQHKHLPWYFLVHSWLDYVHMHGWPGQCNAMDSNSEQCSSLVNA